MREYQILALTIIVALGFISLITELHIWRLQDEQNFLELKKIQ